MYPLLIKRISLRIPNLTWHFRQVKNHSKRSNFLNLFLLLPSKKRKEKFIIIGDYIPFLCWHFYCYLPQHLIYNFSLEDALNAQRSNDFYDFLQFHSNFFCQLTKTLHKNDPINVLYYNSHEQKFCFPMRWPFQFWMLNQK